MYFVLKSFFISLLFTHFLNIAFASKDFKLYYEWTYINFTWETEEDYSDAINSKKYIPENNAMNGVKYYKDKFYIAMPRYCDGAPVTLGFFEDSKDSSHQNPLITPFPDWKTNDLDNSDCNGKLENVQSMEIATNGVMWVIDGVRVTESANCPTKLVLYDINNDGNVVLSYTFPEEIALSKGGFLDDLVLDETDGNFAYIADASTIDPGLIVFSMSSKAAWKLRDPSMFPQLNYVYFSVDGILFTQIIAIDGIALGPFNQSPRYFYYSALSGVNLFTIRTDILKNESLLESGIWRFNVSYIGKKQAQSDGMFIDSKGDLYYGLLPLYGIGRWNVYRSFFTKVIDDLDYATMKWPDSFCVDDRGYLNVLASDTNTFQSLQCQTDKKNPAVFRLMRKYTNSKSYLY